MAYAALSAGMAFQLPKNAMVHACSYPLSQRYHLAHGAACALTLPEAIELNAPAMGERMTRFAQGAGCRDATELAQRVRELRTLGGLPSTLAQAGVPRDELDALVEASFHPLMNNNPLTITPHILRTMYERMYQ
jgi:alcohol dehydrogenase